MKAPAIVIFAKPPEPGRVKTRLLGSVSPQQAAAIHRACLADTVHNVDRLPGCQKCLWVAGTFAGARALAASLGCGHTWSASAQRGRGLGARLERAFGELFDAGHRPVVAVGTDTPWMGPKRIRRALDTLDHADVVLGPTMDGGYYLVGTRRFVPQMFRGIPWSTPGVLEATRRALEKAGVSYRLLPRDFDLDRPADVVRARALLTQNKEEAPALAKLLRGVKERKVNRSSRRRAPRRPSKTRRPGRA